MKDAGDNDDKLDGESHSPVPLGLKLTAERSCDWGKDQRVALGRTTLLRKE